MKRHRFDNELILSEVEKLIARGRKVTIRVRGSSMNPFLADGRDTVTLRGFAPDELQPGVTVLARDATGRFVLHRIVARTGNRLVLQGDGNLRQTEETTVHRVVGVVEAVVRKGRSYAADGPLWRLYTCCWMRLAPIRRWLMALYRRM